SRGTGRAAPALAHGGAARVSARSVGRTHEMRNSSIAAFLAILLVCCAAKHPVNSVPIIYRVGWWAYQEDLSVVALDMQLATTPLNLLNNRTIITIEISADL